MAQMNADGASEVRDERGADMVGAQAGSLVRRERRAVLAAGFLLVAACAQADAGTPFMWATMLHLAIGNAFIGVGEGLLLARLFRVGAWRICPLMVAANYVSMLFGLWGIGRAVDGLNAVLSWQSPLERGPAVLASVAAVSFLVSIVVEWPFTFFALARGERRFSRSLAMSAVAQTASYAVLVPYYLGLNIPDLPLYVYSHDRHLENNRRPESSRTFAGQTSAQSRGDG